MNWFLVPAVVIVSFVAAIFVMDRLSPGEKIKFYWITKAHVLGAFVLTLAADMAAQNLWIALTAPEPNDSLLAKLYVSETEIDRLQAQVRLMERNQEHLQYLLTEEQNRPVQAVVHGFPNFSAYDLESSVSLPVSQEACQSPRSSLLVTFFGECLAPHRDLVLADVCPW